MGSERTDPRNALEETLGVLHGWEGHGVTQQKDGKMTIKTLEPTQMALSTKQSSLCFMLKTTGEYFCHVC